MTDSASPQSREIRRTPTNEALLSRTYSVIPESVVFLDEVAHRMDPDIDTPEPAAKKPNVTQTQPGNTKVETVVADLAAARQLRDARDSVEGAYDVAA